LQGFVTNELAGNSYNIDLSSMLPDLVNLAPNASSIIAFDGIGRDDPLALQMSSFMTLTLAAGDGINPSRGGGNLTNLINCTVVEECFTDGDATDYDEFMNCYVLPVSFVPPKPAPCNKEFSAVLENVDFDEITKCFGSNSTFPNSTDDETAAGRFVPLGFSKDSYDEMEDSSKAELVLCLMRALLPPDLIDTIEDIIAIIVSLFGIVMFVLRIVENGIDLPGVLILFFFWMGRISRG
jgi:hypothetical protein